jgi:type IV fimbrial biogenesis protein FimT
MGKMHSEGVTLVELMLTLIVVSIVMAVGVPGVADLVQNNRMTAATNDLVSSIHLARSEALLRRRPVVICPVDDPAAADPACNPAGDFGAGWLVFTDDNQNAQRDADDVIINVRPALHEQIAGNVTADAGAPAYIAFADDGFRTDLDGVGNPGVTNLQLCDSRGDRRISGGRAAGRWIRVSATGHPRAFAQHGLVQGPDNPLGGC